MRARSLCRDGVVWRSLVNALECSTVRACECSSELGRDWVRTSQPVRLGTASSAGA